MKNPDYMLCTCRGERIALALCISRQIKQPSKCRGCEILRNQIVAQIKAKHKELRLDYVR